MCSSDLPQASIGAIVLAAGASSRMGAPKQLLPIDGVPLLARTVEVLLATPVWPVVVVLGANADAMRPLLARYPVLIADNPAWPEGMASSIRAGITTLRPPVSQAVPRRSRRPHSAAFQKRDAATTGRCDRRSTQRSRLRWRHKIGRAHV